MKTETDQPFEVSLELPEAVLDDIADRVAERIRPRWAELEGTAEYFGVPVRRVRAWRERGMPAQRIGRRLLFDLRACEQWIHGAGD
jgi:hypothetical protein